MVVGGGSTSAAAVLKFYDPDDHFVVEKNDHSAVFDGDCVKTLLICRCHGCHCFRRC